MAWSRVRRLTALSYTFFSVSSVRLRFGVGEPRLLKYCFEARSIFIAQAAWFRFNFSGKAKTIGWFVLNDLVTMQKVGKGAQSRNFMKHCGIFGLLFQKGDVILDQRLVQGMRIASKILNGGFKVFRLFPPLDESGNIVDIAADGVLGGSGTRAGWQGTCVRFFSKA